MHQFKDFAPDVAREAGALNRKSLDRFESLDTKALPHDLVAMR